MSEYEIIDVISSLRLEGAEHVMNFVTVMFSYVVAAYVVGAKLSRFQALFVTALYSFFVPGPILAMYETMVTARDIHVLYGDAVPVNTSAIGWLTGIPIAVPLSLLLAWISSLLFMLHMRRQSSESAE